MTPQTYTVTGTVFGCELRYCGLSAERAVELLLDLSTWGSPDAIATPDGQAQIEDQREAWKFAAIALIFALIAAVIFIGAASWAIAQARATAPVSICEVCGQVLDGTHVKCEAEL